jgi:fluoride exporter
MPTVPTSASRWETGVPEDQVLHTDQTLPTDPDVDLHDPRQRAELFGHHRDVLGVIAAGGALGALARYGIGVAFPAARHGFPWATFGINVLGSLLIGVLIVLVTEVFRNQRLVRPFFGVGVLGGFTTFSTYVVDIQRLVNAGSAGVALIYLFATLLAALLAAYAGIAVTRSVIS